MKWNNFPFYLDVDGSLTIDKKFYSEGPTGTYILAKTFNDKDSYIIEWLKRTGFQVVLISGDTRINKNWADYKKIQFVKAPSYEDKYEVLQAHYRQFIKDESPQENYFYLGDGVPDFISLTRAKLGYVPKNASLFLKDRISGHSNIKILNRSGGNGCLEEMIFDLMEKGILKRETRFNNFV